MTSSLPVPSESVVLRDAVMSVQRDSFKLVSDNLNCYREQGWVIEFSIRSSDCQRLIHTWQRMVHEPTYHNASSRSESYLHYPTHSSYAHYSTASAYSNFASYVHPAASYCGTLGHSVGFVGNNAIGNRRVIYIERIQELEVTLHSIHRECVTVRLRLVGEENLESAIYVNDGSEAGHGC